MDLVDLVSDSVNRFFSPQNPFVSMKFVSFSALSFDLLEFTLCISHPASNDGISLPVCF